MADPTSLSIIIHLPLALAPSPSPIPIYASGYHVSLRLGPTSSLYHIFHAIPAATAGSTPPSSKFEHRSSTNHPEFSAHHSILVKPALSESNAAEVQRVLENTVVPAGSGGVCAQEWVRSALARIETRFLDTGDAEFFYARMMRYINKVADKSEGAAGVNGGTTFMAVDV